MTLPTRISFSPIASRRADLSRLALSPDLSHGRARSLALRALFRPEDHAILTNGDGDGDGDAPFLPTGERVRANRANRRGVSETLRNLRG